MPPGKLGNYKRSSADIAKIASAPLVPIAHNGGEYWLNKSLLKRPGVVQVVVGHPIIVGDKNTKMLMEEIKAWTQQQLAAIKQKS